MVLSPTRTKGTRVRAHINQSTFNRMWRREAASPKSQTGGLLAALVFGFVELGFFFLRGEDSWCCKESLSKVSPWLLATGRTDCRKHWIPQTKRAGKDFLFRASLAGGSGLGSTRS